MTNYKPSTEKLLKAIDSPVFRDGAWSLCERTGWPDNPTYLNLVAWCWSDDKDQYLIVVNLSDQAAQAQVQVRWPNAGGKKWRLIDVLSGATFDRDGDEMLSPGLYVDLGSWSCHFLQGHRNGSG